MNIFRNWRLMNQINRLKGKPVILHFGYSKVTVKIDSCDIWHIKATDCYGDKILMPLISTISIEHGAAVTWHWAKMLGFVSDQLKLDGGKPGEKHSLTIISNEQFADRLSQRNQHGKSYQEDYSEEDDYDSPA